MRRANSTRPAPIGPRESSLNETDRSIRHAEVLENIEEGRWVLPRLGSQYKKHVAKALLGVENFGGSLNAATLAYYGHATNLAELNGLEDQKFFDPTNAPVPLVQLYQRVVAKVFPIGARALPFAAGERAKILNAIQLANQPEALAALTCYVRVDAPVLGTSFPQSFGTVYYGSILTDVSVEDLAVSLCHEAAHHELFLLNSIDRLIESAFDQSLRYAPLQRKVRPPIGRLHSYYALFRMIQAKRRLGFALRDELSLLHATEETFGDDELTPFARALLAACRAHVSGIVYEHC